MASQAISKISDPLFLMFAGDFGLVVTGIAGPLGQVGLVAVGTNVVFLTVVHWERMRSFKTSRTPGGCGMAGRTSLSREHSGVEGRIGMAGSAILRSAFEYIVFMAVLACNSQMSAIKGKCRQAVVKFGILPVVRVVTGATLRAKLAVMRIVGLMAGSAFLRCAFERIIFMAVLACSSQVSAIEHKTRQAVIKCGLLPVVRVVADTTLRPELAVMGIIGLVTGFTRRGRILQRGNCSRGNMAL